MVTVKQVMDAIEQVQKLRSKIQVFDGLISNAEAEGSERTDALIEKKHLLTVELEDLLNSTL